MRSMEYCTGLFVWGLEVCAHLVVGGLCEAGVVVEVNLDITL
jgi:hypothetical protein